MLKRTISLLLAVCLVLLLSTPTIGASTFSNFIPVREFEENFNDVSPEAWYFDSVITVFEHGIMNGRDNGAFAPREHITIAETIRITAMLHRGYLTGIMEFGSAAPWYAPYVEYAEAHGFPIGSFRNLHASATRADFAFILSESLPAEMLTPINYIGEGAIPDVAEGFSFGSAVYRLYRAGVLHGAEGCGSFFPGRTLLRSEAAVIISRIINPDDRIEFSLEMPLTPEQVYRLASPAVFFIDVFDENGESFRTGSGFFICSSGIAVTNHHVIVGGTTATITTASGDVFDVYGISDYNRFTDIAILRILGRGSFPYLELSDSSDVRTGATIYTLGSPLGLNSTFSMGIISQALREVEGMQFIQIDAPISSGSSGGALLDAYGRVIGITTATMVSAQIAQNLNMAVPINLIHNLSKEDFQPLESILIRPYSYEGHYPIPDFGLFFDVRVFNTQNELGGVTRAYRVDRLPMPAEFVIDEYEALLIQLHFVHFANMTRSSGAVLRMFHNSTYGVTVSVGIDTVRNLECVVIHLSGSN